MIVNGMEMTREEVIEQIKDNGFFIEGVENPDEELQLLAIEENPFSIRVIDNPTKKVQMEAVDNFVCCIKYIKKPCQEAIDRVHGLYPTPECISPEDFKYKFYEPVYETMDQIKYDFDCYISSNDKFFKCKTLKAAMNSLFRKNKNGPWNLDDYEGPSQFDIRKIDFSTIKYSKDNFTDYLDHLRKTEFKHGEEIEMYYYLPVLFEADYCPDGHADYLVFRYEGELYLLTLLCFE